MRTNFDQTPWSPEDKATLRELAAANPAQVVATMMGRSLASVRSMMHRESIQAFRSQNWNPWSITELQFLDEHHRTMNLAELARHLNRTEASVRKKCTLIGLSLKRHLHSDEDVSLCRQLFAAGVSRKDIAEKMEIPYQRVAIWLQGKVRKNDE